MRTLSKMRKIKGGKLTALLVVATGIATSVFADVFYQNDFTTRISQEPIPAYGVVREAQPYPAKSAYLCNRPSDIAGACVFLCSPAAAYIHGAIIPVDGGWLAR